MNIGGMIRRAVSNYSRTQTRRPVRQAHRSRSRGVGKLVNLLRRKL